MMSLTRYPSVGFSEATVAAINTGIYRTAGQVEAEVT